MALSRNTFPSLPALVVTTQLLRRNTDKQRPSVQWSGQVTGAQGEGQARDLTAATAVLQLIVSGHVDTTDYTNQ